MLSSTQFDFKLCRVILGMFIAMDGPLACFALPQGDPVSGRSEGQACRTNLEVGKDPVTTTLDIRPNISPLVRRAVTGSDSVVFLEIVDVVPGVDAWVGLRAFLNVPRNDKGVLDRNAMTLGSAHYIGSIAFFPRGDPGDQSFYLDLTPTLKRLAEAEKLPRYDRLTLTLQGIADGPVRVPIRVKRAEVSVDSDPG